MIHTLQVKFSSWFPVWLLMPCSQNITGFASCSPFLKACIEEFTATYDEKLLGWNGAGLLNRVATNTTHAGGKRWLDEPDLLSVQRPLAFFPISLYEVKR